VTLNSEQAATTEAARAAQDLAAHLERLAGRMADLLPIDATELARWDDEPQERLHAFLRMFEQLYDLTARKLFPGYLALSGETIAGLSAQNLFRRVEAIGGIASADRWIEIGVTCNILVHDYPTDPVARAQRANRAWADFPDLVVAARQVIASLKSDKLL
jgi:hypothetical protein